MEISEVYGAADLENALHYETNTFASYYVENLGDGKFKLKELPTEAQLTNLNDALIGDFNEDGNLDVLAVGNLFVSEIETPKSDAGVGLLLLGDGNGNFEPEPNKKSGFYAWRDAKKVASLKVKDTDIILVANNNDVLQSFEWQKTRH